MTPAHTLFRIAIVVRDGGQRARIARILRQQTPVAPLVHEPGNGRSALRFVLEAQPSILFLEQELRDVTGTALLRSVPAPQRPYTILFATDRSAAYDAIRSGVSDLLLMSETDERIAETIATALVDRRRSITGSTPSRTAPDHGQIALKVNNGLTVLHLHDIVYVRSHDDMIEVHHLHQPRLTLSRRLKDIEALLLPAGFIRIHQSHLVNRSHITHYVSKAGQQTVTLSNGRSLPVSKRLKDNVLKAWTTL